MINKIYSYVLFFSNLIKKKISHPTDKLMVDIGGGTTYKKGWKNLDFKNKYYAWSNLLIDYDYDLTSKKRIPFDDESVDMFFSSHTFEHIKNENIEFIFKEIYRSLKIGGTFRISVPDMELIYNKFKEKNIDFFRYWMVSDNMDFVHAFMYKFTSAYNVKKEKIMNDFSKMNMEKFFDNYTKDLEQNPEKANLHINWFTYKKLEKMLKETGFSKIKKSEYKGSQLKEFRQERLDKRPHWSLFVECEKQG